MKDQNIWVSIVKQSLSYPIRQIVENSWKEWSVIINKISESKEVNFLIWCSQWYFCWYDWNLNNWSKKSRKSCFRTSYKSCLNVFDSWSSNRRITKDWCGELVTILLECEECQECECINYKNGLKKAVFSLKK